MAFDPNASFDVLEAPAPRKAPAFDPSATFEVVGAPSKTGDGGGSAASPPTWGNLPQISKIGQAYDRITGAVIEGAKAGWGPTQSPETAAANAASDRDLPAPLAAVAKGVNWLTDNSGRPFKAAIGGLEAGLAQTGEEAGVPGLGRDAAAAIPALPMMSGMRVPQTEIATVRVRPEPPPSAGGPRVEPTFGPDSRPPGGPGTALVPSGPGGGPPEPSPGPGAPALPAPVLALPAPEGGAPTAPPSAPLALPAPETPPPSPESTAPTAQPAPQQTAPPPQQTATADPPQIGKRVTFFDPESGDYASGKLIGIHKNGSFVVDRGAGPYQFVDPGRVVAEREVAERSAPNAPNARANDLGAEKPKPAGPLDHPENVPAVGEQVTLNGQPHTITGYTQFAPNEWTFTARGPDGQEVTDGLNVLRGQANRPAPLQDAPQGPWEPIGKNKEGQTVYENPQGAHAVNDSGVPYVEPTQDGMPVAEAERPPTWTVYHGSPHEFAAFDVNKIGTGEGNQSFGHGLYGAESPKVGAGYRDNVSVKQLIDRAKDAYDEFDSPSDAEAALFANPDLTDRERNLLQALKADDWLGFDYPHQAVRAAFKELNNYDPSPELRKAVADFGSLYTVRLNATPAEMLDWDSPLSAQSEGVKRALADMGIGKPVAGAWQKSNDGTWTYQNDDGKILARVWQRPSGHWAVSAGKKETGAFGVDEAKTIGEAMAQETFGEHNKTGEEIYRSLVMSPKLSAPDRVSPNEAGDWAIRDLARRKKELSAILRAAGIKGIMYFDAGSRKDGEGTRNVVVFDHGDMEITHRNGEPVAPKPMTDAEAQEVTGGRDQGAPEKEEKPKAKAVKAKSEPKEPKSSTDDDEPKAPETAPEPTEEITPESAAEAEKPTDSGPEESPPPPESTPALIEHTTKKGKTLRGVVRTDLTKEQAKAIDPYSFAKDGGFFIREAHLDKLPAAPKPEPIPPHLATQGYWARVYDGDNEVDTDVYPTREEAAAAAFQMVPKARSASTSVARDGKKTSSDIRSHKRPLIAADWADDEDEAPPASETASAPAPARDSMGRAAGSWVVTEKATGAPVMETFSKKVADAINKDKFNVVPIGDHLAGLNKKPPATEDEAPPVESKPTDTDPLSAPDDVWERALYDAANRRWDAGQPVQYNTQLKVWRLKPENRDHLRYQNGHIQAREGGNWINLGPIGQAIDSLANNLGLPTSYGRTIYRAENVDEEGEKHRLAAAARDLAPLIAERMRTQAASRADIASHEKDAADKAAYQALISEARRLGVSGPDLDAMIDAQESGAEQQEAGTQRAEPAAATRTPRARTATPFTPLPRKPLSLIDFLRQPVVMDKGTIHERTIPGGVKDYGGELATMVGGNRARPGLINNKSGRSFNDALIHAWEGGYFPEYGEEAPRDENAILEAIRDELAGNKRYSIRDQDAVDAYHDALAQNDEIDRLAQQYGIDAAGLTRDQFFDALADRVSLEDLAAEIARMEDDQLTVMGEVSADDDWHPAELYGNDGTRTLEDLEDEYRQEDAATGSQGGDQGVGTPGYAGSPSGEGEVDQGQVGSPSGAEGGDGAQADGEEGGGVVTTEYDADSGPWATPSDLPYDAAVDAHRWNSHTPEARARQMQRDVSRDINAVGDRLSAKADTPEQKAVLATDMAKFKSDYLGKYQGVMAARGRTASSMVTGPAKFPTARNQKALDAEQKKATDFNDWRNRAIKAMEKRLQDARTSDQIDREAMVKLIKAVDDAMNTVQQIDADDPRWRGFDRSAFTRSISGVLKRLGDFGKTNQINAALAHITERQAGWAKPFFAPNNSVWKLATEDGGTPEVPSSLSETPPFLFKSETIRSTDRRGNLTEVYVNPGAGTLTNLLKERDGHVRFLVGGDNIAVARARDMTHPQIAYSLADAAHPMVDDVRREGGGRWFVRRESAPGPGRYPFGNMNISVGNGRGDLPVEQWPAGLRRAVGGLGLEDGLAESPTPLYSIARDAALRDVASITRADIRDAADRIVSEVEAAGFVLTKVNRSGLSDSTYLRFERPDGQAIDATKSGRRRYWTETGGSFPSIMSGGFNVRISDHNAVGGPTEVHSGVRVGPTQDAGIYATAKKARLLAEVQRKPMGQIGGELAESPTPLYSAVSRAVDNLKQTKGTGEQFLSMISKTPGVKPEEVKWLGLDDWLKGQKSVTKEAIQDYVRAHALDVREVTKGATADDGPDEGHDPDMDAYLASRGKPQPVHSFDLTPELLHAATTEGMALFERKAPLPPRTGPDLFGGNRAEPTARTPEPTIRNDQRQVDMFGRNDAAIQAQAARDAAGPRSNQQPANEGLFARPETPQPALPMARVSRWLSGGGENFVDHLASAPTRGHASAADWVMLRGGNTGHEYIAVVDNQTGEIVHAGTNGKPRSVGFEGTNTLNDNDAYTIHHNHPRGTALSDTDLTMLANPGISHVVAHGHGGEVSIASLGPKWALRGAAKNAENAIANTRELRHVVFAADSRARGVLQGMINRGELSIDDGNLHFHDFRNRLLNAIGTINYVSSHRLPASLMAAFRAELNKMGVKPDATGSYDRFTVAIRPEERVAGLPGGVDTRPAQGPARGQGGGRAGPAVSPRQPQARLLEGDVTDTPAFRRWFGNSRVVDADGKPLVVYHGTAGDFDEFRPSGTGRTTMMGIPVDVERHGIFFTPDPGFASGFATQGRRTNANIIPTYLKIERPLVMDENGVSPSDVARLVAAGIDRKWLENHAGDPRSTWESFEGDDADWFVGAIKDAGFDGVQMREEDPDTRVVHDVYIAFSPTQIKSAIGNRGTFDPASPNILEEAAD